MNAHEKRAFIVSLCDSIRDDLIKKVPNMPEDWDGHELRALIEREATTQNFGACASKAALAHYPYREHYKRRRKAFESECAVRNL